MPGPARCLLMEAVVWLGIARASVLAMPYRKVVSRLSLWDQVLPSPDPEEARDAITRVTWAIATVGRHTPWESNCLARAIAAKVMLRRRGLESTLYLGVRPGAESLTAHAWLGHHRSVLIGDGDLAAYAVVWTSGEAGR